MADEINKNLDKVVFTMPTKRDWLKHCKPIQIEGGWFSKNSTDDYNKILFEYFLGGGFANKAITYDQEFISFSNWYSNKFSVSPESIDVCATWQQMVMLIEGTRALNEKIAWVEKRLNSKWRWV